MSEMAVETLTRDNIPHTYDRKVLRIACQTETLLAEIDDPQQAYDILCQRAGRCRGSDFLSSIINYTKLYLI